MYMALTRWMGWTYDHQHHPREVTHFPCVLCLPCLPCDFYVSLTDLPQDDRQNGFKNESCE